MTQVIELYGHKLRFDFNAVCLIEGVTGPQIWDVLEKGMLQPSFIILRAIFWGGLHRHNPDISILGAGDILGDAINEHGPTKVTQDMMAALDAAFPDKKAGGDDKAPGKPDLE